MSPRKFEEIVNDLAEAGLDEEYITELRGSWDASPLRRERDELKTQAQAALDRANRYESIVAATRFRELGIEAKPEAYRTPDDLDWADEAKVRSWVTEMGIIKPAPPEPPSGEVEGHARITDAAQGAPASRHDPRAELLAKTDPALGVSEDQFWAEMRAAGMTSDTTIDQ